MAERPRILVLSSSTGSGHDKRAQTFVDWVAHEEGDAVEVRREQIIENGSTLGAFGVQVYNSIQRRAPRLHRVYWHIVERLVGTHAERVTFGGRYYRRLLAAYRPHLVFSVHDSTNRGYFADARQVLGAANVRCATYCGEYTGGPGYSHNWVDPTADWFGARTEEARDFAVRLGMPRERTTVLGAFLPPAIEEPVKRAEGLAGLGLSTDRLTLLLATGGFGANHHRAFLRALAPLAAHVQVIAVCGRNQAAFKRLEALRASGMPFPLHVEGFSQKMGTYLQLADAVVARGGANTATEALEAGCPLVFDALDGSMPQEDLTLRYFAQHAEACVLRRANELADVVRAWIDQPERLVKQRQKMGQLRRSEAMATVVGQLLALAREAAGEQSTRASVADFSTPSAGIR